MPCQCRDLPDFAIIRMEDGDVMGHFEEVRHRGDPWWWLDASKCRSCGTFWLKAQEERQNDIILLRRLSRAQVDQIQRENRWPSEFDQYETLLRLGHEAGYRARFFDPLGDSSLAWVIGDLARQRPGIKVSEIAQLLNLDVKTAAVLIEKAVMDHDLNIDRESDSWP
jgi:hypothetical protein